MNKLNLETFNDILFGALKDQSVEGQIKMLKAELNMIGDILFSETAELLDELEKLADESYKAYCIAFNSDDRAEYDAYTNAIEIVKQGGVIEAEQKLKEMESD